VRGSEPRATLPAPCGKFGRRTGRRLAFRSRRCPELARAAFDVSREYVLIRRTIRVRADTRCCGLERNSGDG
jgi:hypothetical protein